MSVTYPSFILYASLRRSRGFLASSSPSSHGGRGCSCLATSEPSQPPGEKIGATNKTNQHNWFRMLDLKNVLWTGGFLPSGPPSRRASPAPRVSIVGGVVGALAGSAGVHQCLEEQLGKGRTRYQRSGTWKKAMMPQKNSVMEWMPQGLACSTWPSGAMYTMVTLCLLKYWDTFFSV